MTERQIVDAPRVRRSVHFMRHEELVGPGEGVGEASTLSISEILRRLPDLSVWSEGDTYDRRSRLAGVHRILEWLMTHSGDNWQQRWLASGADDGLDKPWLDALIAADRRSRSTNRTELTRGVSFLLLGRVVLPSYTFLASYNATGLYRYVRRTFRPDLFADIEQKAATYDLASRQRENGLVIISKLVLHTGRDVDQLTAEDIFAYRAWLLRHTTASGGGKAKPHFAWHLLRGVADLGPHESLREALRFGQRPIPDLVDDYGIACQPIRDVFIRYLTERQAAMDHASLRSLVRILVKNFWTDIERHHPGIDTLHLSEEIAEAWKQRLNVVRHRDGTTRPRKQYLDILLQVRGFYLDIQEWAAEDPAWAAWAVPSPVRKGETSGMAKVKKRTTAEMHQRVRDRLPHLPVLVDTAECRRAAQASLLAAAASTPIGETFAHDGREFRRTVPRSYYRPDNRNMKPKAVLAKDLVTGETINVTHEEDDAFWSWAIIETLRHTGIRVEELAEITHLALVSYQLPDTGEIVPMLQIVPSKTNEERLLLVGPELASVLATIITRVRDQNGGTLPLTVRYDPYEQVSGPPLPHLFQRRLGWQWKVPSHSTILALLAQTLAHTGLKDAAGQALNYTPHDFRRMFATEAVTGGLPVHIVARILGHANITTTQAYMAVFDEELVRTYRAFLDKRRALRPAAEYREPTTEEWRGFQQHFELRKVSLGDCGRPYATPCQHEHACVRCPMLRVSPRQRARLVEIVGNLRERITEAKLNGWLGEVQGLQVSLDAAHNKLVNLDRSLTRIDNVRQSGTIDLGIPTIEAT